jgi:hypothetical protein
MVALSYTASGLFMERLDWDWSKNKEIERKQKDFEGKILVDFCSNKDRPRVEKK